MRRDSPDPRSTSSTSSCAPTTPTPEQEARERQYRETEARLFEMMRRVKVWPIRHEPPVTEATEPTEE